MQFKENSLMSQTAELDKGLLAVAQRFDVSGRRALVTGGSLSIGRALSVGLAEAGADLIVHASPDADARYGHPNAASETRDAISAIGRKVAVVAADLLLPGAGTWTIQQGESAFGGIDILVICASIQLNGDLADVTPEDVARQVRVNFTAPIEMLQAALPAMLDRGWGRVVSIGSVNSIRPNRTLPVYAALKAALHNLIMNLARQHAARGVTLNTLSPGFTATERNRWRRTDAVQWAESVKKINPMGRAGVPEDMVGGALLLCSDAGSFITGADLQISGGAHLL
jgi:NAD(P)-dependent dehydrogenase (short-subunit alcohol dehydrogenase family)